MKECLGMKGGQRMKEGLGVKWGSRDERRSRSKMGLKG